MLIPLETHLHILVVVKFVQTIFEMKIPILNRQVMTEATPLIQIYLVQIVEFIVSAVLVYHFMSVIRPQNLIKDSKCISRSLNLLHFLNILKCLAWENRNVLSVFGK